LGGGGGVEYIVCVFYFVYNVFLKHFSF